WLNVFNSNRCIRVERQHSIDCVCRQHGALDRFRSLTNGWGGGAAGHSGGSWGVELAIGIARRGSRGRVNFSGARANATPVRGSLIHDTSHVHGTERAITNSLHAEDTPMVQAAKPAAAGAPDGAGTPTSLLTDFDLYLFNEGTHVRIYQKLGAH